MVTNCNRLRLRAGTKCTHPFQLSTICRQLKLLLLMETRKLVKSGLSSHVVALPHDFIQDNKLRKGDTIYIHKKSPQILELSIKPESQNKNLKNGIKEIHIKNRSMHYIQREIIKAYINNADEIVIYLNNSSEAKKIKEYISSLVALEVVQEDNKKIVAKDFLNYKDKEVERTLRRIEHIVCSMIQDLKEIDQDEPLAQVIIERDREVNRLSFLAMRILFVASTNPEISSILQLNSSSILRLWNNNMHLEKIGDCAKRLGKELGESKILAEKKTFYAILDQTVAHYKETFNAIHKNDQQQMDESIERRFELLKQIDLYIEENNSISTSRITSQLKQILSHLSDTTRIYRFCQSE